MSMANLVISQTTSTAMWYRPPSKLDHEPATETQEDNAEEKQEERVDGAQENQPDEDVEVELDGTLASKLAYIPLPDLTVGSTIEMPLPDGTVLSEVPARVSRSQQLSNLIDLDDALASPEAERILQLIDKKEKRIQKEARRAAERANRPPTPPPQRILTLDDPIVLPNPAKDHPDSDEDEQDDAADSPAAKRKRHKAARAKRALASTNSDTGAASSVAGVSTEVAPASSTDRRDESDDDSDEDGDDDDDEEADEDEPEEDNHKSNSDSESELRTTLPSMLRFGPSSEKPPEPAPFADAIRETDWQKLEEMDPEGPPEEFFNEQGERRPVVALNLLHRALSLTPSALGPVEDALVPHAALPAVDPFIVAKPGGKIVAKQLLQSASKQPEEIRKYTKFKTAAEVAQAKARRRQMGS